MKCLRAIAFLLMFPILSVLAQEEENVPQAMVSVGLIEEEAA